jgi:hypothetical protein
VHAHQHGAKLLVHDTARATCLAMWFKVRPTLFCVFASWPGTMVFSLHSTYATQ